MYVLLKRYLLHKTSSPSLFHQRHENICLVSFASIVVSLLNSLEQEMTKSSETTIYWHSGNDALQVLTSALVLFISKSIFLTKLAPKRLVKTSSTPADINLESTSFLLLSINISFISLNMNVWCFLDKELLF